jgi:hypothetical protein
LIVILVLIVLIGSLINAPFIAGFVRVVRDVMLSAMGLTLLLVVVAVSILIIQIARFVNLLYSESKPIVQDARETVNAVKTTAQLAATESTELVATIKAFFKGLRLFITALFNLKFLWSLLRRSRRRNPTTPVENQPTAEGE